MDWARWPRREDTQKDVSLALEFGRSVKMPLPRTSVSNDYPTARRAMGLERKDFVAVFEVLAKMAGVNE